MTFSIDSESLILRCLTFFHVSHIVQSKELGWLAKMKSNTSILIFTDNEQWRHRLKPASPPPPPQNKSNIKQTVVLMSKLIQAETVIQN